MTSIYMQGDAGDQIFVSTLRLATQTAFDETGRTIENDLEYEWYSSSSADIMLEGGLIRIQHQCRKYDHELGCHPLLP